jgi:DNA topoisomerase-1
VKKAMDAERQVNERQLGTDPVSGRPISARLGRFGPFVQKGTMDDAENP